jgi:hypothetical protein
MSAIMKRSMLGRWQHWAAALFVVALVGLFASGVALAGSTPTQTAGGSAASDEYYKPAPKPKPVVKSQTAAATTQTKPAAAVKSSGTLPFTGMSLIWPVVGALCLVGLGLGIRRYERKH